MGCRVIRRQILEENQTTGLLVEPTKHLMGEPNSKWDLTVEG